MSKSGPPYKDLNKGDNLVIIIFIMDEIKFTGVIADQQFYTR